MSSGGATQTGGVAAGGSADAGSAGFTCRVERPTECKEPATTYAQVAPIFAQRCVVCHGMKAGHWPLNAYDHIAHWADSVAGLVSACAMPPLGEGGPIPVEEADQILNFIRCGLKKE